MGVTDEAVDRPDTRDRRVRWGRVGLFYAIALGWVSLVTAGLYLLGERSFASPGLLAQAAIALLYMPAPMAAALIVGRLDPEPALIRHTFEQFWRRLPRLVLVVSVLTAGLLAGLVSLSWLLGNWLGLPSVGTVLFSQQDLLASLLQLVPAMNADQVAALSASAPGFWALLGLVFIGALVAGFTVNGLFAFGEEYGWRGWLAEELRPLGPVGANLLTGVLWGLWHTPLILLGFNYGEYTRLGPLVMVAWCVPLSFVLWRAREVTGSLLAPAVLHGAVNGFAGVFLIILADRHPLVAPPAGLVAAATYSVVAAIFWIASQRWVHPGS